MLCNKNNNTHFFNMGKDRNKGFEIALEIQN